MKAIENIKRLREAKGIPKTFVARKLGMTLQGYRYLESGSTRLDVERMRAIGNALDVNCGVFLDDELTDSVINRIEGGIA